MAGDWIKMRLDLAQDPAVIFMAEELGMPEQCVVGYLHSVWSWASRNCYAGSVTGASLKALGRVTQCERVPELMVQVGWLEESLSDDGRPVLTFPKWDNHLSNSAKTRAQAKNRMQKKRCADVTHTAQQERNQRREEKRREDTNKKQKEIPPPLEECVEYGVDVRGMDRDDVEGFYDHFSANGWRVSGKAPMKDWKAALRNWQRTGRRFAVSSGNGHKKTDADYLREIGIEVDDED